MKNDVHNILHDRILAQAGLHGATAQSKIKWTAEMLVIAKEKKWSKRFEELMRTYFLMGTLRYETPENAIRGRFIGRPTKVQTERMINDLREYQRTGNKEKLVDVANFCMIEFETSDHPTSHFKGTDRHDHTQP